MTAQIVSALGRMEALEMQIGHLQSEHHRQAMELYERHRKVLEPLQARLSMLQRSCYRAGDLIAELQTLRNRWWELEERVAAAEGYAEGYERSENEDADEQHEIGVRKREIEGLLKLLGVDPEEHSWDRWEPPSLEIRSRVARARWLAEVAKWPSAFGRALCREIEHRSSPDLVADRTWGTEYLDDARAEVGRESYQAAVWRAMEHPRKMAQGRHDGGRYGARLLAEGKEQILWVLFAHGKRRITREDVQPMLERMVCADRESATERLSRVRGWIADLERRLPHPVYTKGNKKGMPLPESRRQALERDLAQYRAEVPKLEDRLQRLSDPDPLYASGFWRRPVKRATGCLPRWAREGAIFERDGIALRALMDSAKEVKPKQS